MDQQDPQDKRSKNRQGMPAVAELIDAHIEAFGDNFTLLKCIDYGTRNRVTLKGQIPYQFPDEMAVDEALHEQNN